MTVNPIRDDRQHHPLIYPTIDVMKDWSINPPFNFESSSQNNEGQPRVAANRPESGSANRPGCWPIREPWDAGVGQGGGSTIRSGGSSENGQMIRS